MEFRRVLFRSEVPEYEPPSSASVEAVAAREGRSPQEVVLDWLLENDGKAFLFAPLASYVHHNLDAVREMIDRKSVVYGTSVSVRVALGGRRIIKQKNKHTYRPEKKHHRH